MGVLGSLLLKEVRQIMRNPFYPKLFVLFPVLMIMVAPWLATMDVQNVKVGIVTGDNSDITRKIINEVESSEYFTFVSMYQDFNSGMSGMDEGLVDVLLEIPDDFGASVLVNPKKLSIHANGVNAMKASLGSNYLTQIVIRSLTDIRASRGLQVQESPIETTTFYNQTMDYKHYMIPAVMIMLLVLMGGFLPALNLVMEKEIGTIEQINVTPVSRFTFVLSKLIPFWVVCFIDLGICMILAKLTYGLSVAGSVWVIFLGVVLFIIVISGLSVTIANLSNTMQQTMFLMLFVVLVFILLSGIMTPVDSMPHWAQILASFLPPTYIVDIVRFVYLKGVTISELWRNFAALAGFAVIFCALATITYRKRG